MTPPEWDGRALTARYEDLRRWALAPDGALPHPRGLALLVQLGVPAWMRAWTTRLPPRPAAAEGPRPRAAALPPCRPAAPAAQRGPGAGRAVKHHGPG
jgi:hypothetical protein